MAQFGATKKGDAVLLYNGRPLSWAHLHFGILVGPGMFGLPSKYCLGSVLKSLHCG